MKRLTAILAVALLAAGCASYRNSFMKQADEKKWTEEQKLAAYAFSFRVQFTKENGDGTYGIIYSRLSVKEIREKLDGYLADLNDLLGYKDPETVKFVDTFNLRKDLEREERVTEAIRSRVRAVELDAKFKELMGQRSYEMDYSDPSPNKGEGYNPKKIFLAPDMAKEFPFTSDQIESAKARGTLKPIETATMVLDQKFERKEQDPASPDDKNAFVWKARKVGLELANYKILDVDKPDNNRGNYIEGYRVIDGKKESKPALKIFMPADASFSVVVLSSAQEGRDTGFGLPDFVLEAYGLANVQTVLRDENVLKLLFDEKEKTNRVAPTPKRIAVDIARVKEPMDLWEKAPNPEGWIVHFKYQNEHRDNYRVRVKFAKPPKGHEEGGHEIYGHHIEYIAKEWTGNNPYQPSAGNVVEYYHPKERYAVVLGAKVLGAVGAQEVKFLLPDGTEETGFITPMANKFIEDAPYAAAYTEGQKRWWIEKGKGSKIFNKRKPTGVPAKKLTEEGSDTGHRMDTDESTYAEPDQINLVPKKTP